MTPTPNGRPPVPASSAPRPTSIEVRVAALQAAATFAGGKALSTEVSTADVLKVATAFERWLLGQDVRSDSRQPCPGPLRCSRWRRRPPPSARLTDVQTSRHEFDSHY